MTDLTPMVKQYLEIKAQHQDAIVFYRLGDFYEMFNQDAEIASKELDLVLTGRGVNENKMPMCGIPFHAAENYISRLIEKGHKVAICEQVEDAKFAKGLVKREVIRIITPGTLIESNLLNASKNNYLAAISKEKNKYGLAFIDASTGEFYAAEFDDRSRLLDELKRLEPSELLFSDLMEGELEPRGSFAGSNSVYKDVYDLETAEANLKNFFKVMSLSAFGLDEVKAAWPAACAILDYLKQTQKTDLGQVQKIKVYHHDQFMFIDSATRKNLELVSTIRDKSFKGSLLWVLDNTKTPMGGRLLRKWVLLPLMDKNMIEQRLDGVEELSKNADVRLEIANVLVEMSDIERISGRIAGLVANARDLIALKQTLSKLAKIKQILGNVKSSKLKQVHKANDFKNIIDLIEKAIVDDPPFALKEGGIIKPGFDKQADEVGQLARGGKDWVAALENEERKRTGIKSLKVGYTKVFGYYIEVTNSNLEQVPDNYIRKQTLTNCERFITPELKEKEALILNADERMKEIEYQLFGTIRAQVNVSTPQFQDLANVLAEIDCLLGLAQIAVNNRYVRPQITEDTCIKVSGSRHPVVEKTIGEHEFVPNSIEMANDADRFLLITGPNMAGKSTYMRQVALICLMAQIGSFVPAKTAALGLVDRIFTRIGAMDDIFSGQSTFMLEMTETANILNNATDKSLIILDEIGRGTATFDGMSIAAAVAEYIHTNIKAKTLFATHYHEITQLADKHAGMKNLNVLVSEKGDQITFLHKIVEGTADKSYGIQVAKLAGLPDEVVKRAKEIYNTLEMVESDLGKVKAQRSKVKTTSQNANNEQARLF